MRGDVRPPGGRRESEAGRPPRSTLTSRRWVQDLLWVGIAIGLIAPIAPAAVTAVSSGLDHTMFVLSDGTLVGMGGNYAGQLGDPAIVFKSTRPTRISSGVRTVAAGTEHTLFVKVDGTLWAMGGNSVGQLGDGSTTRRWSPVQVATGVMQVSTRKMMGAHRSTGPHTLFIKADRTLWATGANDYGQLGDGTKTGRTVPVQVAEGVASVGAGADFTMFVKADGSLWRMGRSVMAGNRVDLLRPVQVATGVSSVSCGGDTAVVVMNDHTLWEFGSAFEGRELVSQDVQEAAFGNTHLAFVKTDGTLWTRGRGVFGELGRAQLPTETRPGRVASAVSAVAAAGYQTFFIMADGSLWGTGVNELGQLGDGSTDNRFTPTKVPQLLGLPSIGWPPESLAVYPRQPVSLTVHASGSPPLSYQWSKDGADLRHATAFTYTLPASAPGDVGTYRVRVWNAFGTILSEPTDLLVVSPIQQVKSVAVTNEETFVLQDGGSLWATGLNDYGQLGDGTTETRYALTKVADGVASVSAGEGHAVFVKTDGTLWGMGRNYYGPESSGESRLVPEQLAAGVSAVSAGRSYTMFIKTDGSLWGMGDNYEGQAAPSLDPWIRVPVQVALGVAAVSAGHDRTAFVKHDGTLWHLGQLRGQNVGKPVQIANEVVSCSVGEHHTLFIKRDRSLWGYGAGHDGELAPATGYQDVPVLLATEVRAADGVTGTSGSLFIKTDGTLWAMGGSNITGRYGGLWSPVVEQTYLGYENVIMVAGGGGHTVFVRSDGSAWGMGVPSTGRLGLGFSAAPNERVWRPVRLCHSEDMPFFAEHPTNARVALHGTLSLRGVLDQGVEADYQWQRNGADLGGHDGANLTLAGFGPMNVGLYSLVAFNAIGEVASDCAVVGLGSTAKVVGGALELQPSNIVHPNGNIFDQVLLQGRAAAITSDFEQSHVSRLSFVDPDDDIVQVEFSGPGTLALVLDDPSGPAPPANYNQPGVHYMKGRASIVITGADERTNVSVFTVGRATAFDGTGRFRFLEPISPANDPANNGSPLFAGHQHTGYDGIADITFIAISSSNGRFGGLRTANAHYAADAGLVGVYAPGVAFDGPVIVGEINASHRARPVLVLGSASDVRIAGGDVMPANGLPIEVSGISRLRFTAGSDSHGRQLAAQVTEATFTQRGRDVTDSILAGP